jgi:hypothetical protein
MRKWRPKFSLRGLMLLVFVVAVLISGLAIYPRTMTLGGNARWSGEYTGLGFTWDNSLLGFRFRKFTIDDSPNGYWEIQNVGNEFNPVKGFYPNGTIRMKGTCRIDGVGPHQHPLFDDVDDAVFYRPDGSIASTIVDGTGWWKTFHASGQQAFEVEYRNHEKVSMTYWSDDGSLPLLSNQRKSH